MQFIGKCNKLFYSFIQVAVYIIAWLHQRTFYTNQMLNISYTKTAEVFDVQHRYFLSAGTIVTVFLVYPNCRFSISNGCVELPNEATFAV